ncbi:MAG: hypothetical protein ACN4GW_08220 [Desulforhopalus sp.]
MEADRERKKSMPFTRGGVVRSILSRVGGLFKTSLPEDELIEYVVNTVEPRLREVKGYRQRLQVVLRVCRGHCRAMVVEIPGPVLLKKAEYRDEPVIRAAFTGPERIEELLGRGVSTPSNPELPGPLRVGLLTMRSTEKKIFGRKQQGNMVVADIAMRSINFTDHNLVGLAATLADSREALENLSLEIIAEAAARELSEVRTRLVDLRQRQEQLRAMRKMFGGSGTGTGMGCVFVPFDPEKHEKKKKLEQMLVETENKIAIASKGSETPEDWLTIVENFLSKPEDILSMQLITLRLDWSNVLTNDPDEKANVITLATFTMSDEMQREGVLVVYEQT